MATTTKDLKDMTLAEIADVIGEDWEKVRAGGSGPLGMGQHPANPYWSAMRGMRDVSDTFGYDTGDSIVRYFLSNATHWRGETAKAVKAELKRRIA
jgi:hypothetical protein